MHMTPLDCFANAMRMTLAMLCEDLEKSGCLDRKAFADRVRKMIDAAEELRSPERHPADDLDLFFGRMFADTIYPQAASAGSKGWQPVVVDGGKGETKDD